MLDVVYYQNRSRIRAQKRRGCLHDGLLEFYSEESVLHDMFRKEIALIDRRIDEINGQYARIKEDLESLYCTLRCECKEYRTGNEGELIALSHRADACIGEVYSLQNRRKLLQDLINQSR